MNKYFFYNEVLLISIKCNFKHPVYTDIEYKLFCEKFSKSSENIYLFNEEKNNSFKEYQSSKLLGDLIEENINSKFENILFFLPVCRAC